MELSSRTPITENGFFFVHECMCEYMLLAIEAKLNDDYEEKIQESLDKHLKDVLLLCRSLMV